MTLKRFIADAITALAVLSSITTAGLVARRELRASDSGGATKQPPPVRVESWRKYLDTGRLLGSPSAPLRFAEFADFQCPACRGMNAEFRRLQTRYPNAFAISYHYLPLSYHKRAYAAARAAECAAQQGRFEAFHDSLFSRFESLDTLVFTDVAAQTKVPNLDEFTTCASATSVVAQIERDLAWARDTLHVRGTPALIVDGNLYEPAPPIADLTKMIADAYNRHQPGRR